MKGKKRGLNREIVTLGGKKKQETAERRKLKRKMNLQRGMAGIPAIRKSKSTTPLQDSPISVLFIDNTKGGNLAKIFRQEEKRLGNMTGYNIRVAEMAGMALSRLLPSTNPWGAGDCEREDCPVCNQGDEKQQNCKKRNILYESSCKICQVDGSKAGKIDRKTEAGNKGVYVGESSRSMYERGKEHQKDGKDKAHDSHQWKHWALDHPDMEGDPQFRLKIVSSFSDPLTRQLAEAVRIERRGADILNSKSEFSRCRIPRLRLDMEEWQKSKKKVSTTPEEASTVKEPTVGEEDDQTLMEDLDHLELEARRMEKKRKGDIQEKRPKRRKLDKLVGWGEEMDGILPTGMETWRAKISTTSTGIAQDEGR